MQITISSAVLQEQLQLIRRVLLKWDEAVANGIPGQDGPPIPEDRFEALAREMRAELTLCGDICHSLAARLIDGEE